MVIDLASLHIKAVQVLQFFFWKVINIETNMSPYFKKKQRKSMKYMIIWLSKQS
jgi:uncharacterized protein YbcV (DUF1398 family)